MKKALKWTGAVLLLALCLIVAAFTFANLKTSKALHATFTPPALNLTVKGDPAVGERIVKVRNGCVDCHGSDLAGHAMIDDHALGKLYAPNLTPYGLKDWTDDQIAKAIRFGLNRENKPLIFMPSVEYHQLNETDLASVVAYLRTLPEVPKEREALTVGPLAKVLFATGNMPLLASVYLIDFSKGFNTKPEEAPTAEFGHYLAKSACVGCHGVNFAGGPIPGAPPEWPPAASLHLAKNSVWTEESFSKAMREGVSPVTGGNIRPPMPVALTKQLNDTEMRALWLYLSSIN